MMIKFTKKQLTVYLAWRAVEIGLVVMLIGLIAVLSQQIQSVRRTVLIERLTLESSLKGAVRIGALRAEMAKRQHDIQRIMDMVPGQNNIGDVLSALEREANNQQVSMTVPSLIKVMGADKAGQEISAAGPLQDIKLKVKVEGPPNNVLQFFHAVENLPYLVGVTGFKLGTGQFRGVNSGRLGPVTNLPEGEEEIEIEIPKIVMSFDLILSSFNQKEEN